MTHHPMPYDVAICGGGLAGLTLALQLRGRAPDASIVVLEPTRRPLPDACHKVGESTVEIGGRYLGHVLGLHDYLSETHLLKNGLRFFSGQPRAPLVERAEMGPRESPTVPSYQLDRGRLETHLRERCEAERIELREGWGVRDVRVGEPHRLSVVQTRSGEAPEELEARWLIDATGRRRLLARKLGLHEPIAEQASSSWFRVEERVRIDELVPSAERAWHERDVDGDRWLSTNHLCGRGYWVWIIPLASGHTSIGIVAEASEHPFSTFSTADRALSWLAEHEPALAARLEGVPLADFIAMKDYRHDASRVFAEERWALAGESGRFLDPLYSPGSDLIGLVNTLISELVIDDLEGHLDPARVAAFDGFYRDWIALLERTLVRGSRVMGAPEVFAAKLHWDFFYYWAFMCPYYFSRCFALNPAEHERFHAMLHRYTELNDRAQRALQAWCDLAPADPAVEFVGLPAVATTLSDLHLALHEERDVDETYAAMERAAQWAEEIVTEIMLRGLRRAGSDGAAAFIEATGVSWAPPASRFEADEAGPRQRRRLLGKAVRDMERSVGKNATVEGPTLRELWALTVR